MVHPVIGNPNKPASYRRILSDPYVLMNSLLRFILFYFAAFLNHWHSGDTNHYIFAAEQVCKGEWGGEPFRVPMYNWYLCISSFGKIYRGIGEFGSGGVFYPILFQTLIVFLMGLFVYRKWGRKPSIFWLYDPVLIVYSYLIMSDVLFGVIVVLYFSFFSFIFLNTKNKLLNSTLFGFFWACLILTRPIATPVSLLSVIFIFIFYFKKYLKLKEIALIFLVFFVTISPRLYWNYTKTNKIFISNQSGGWIKEVAGIVANSDKNKSFYDATVDFEISNPGNNKEIIFSTFLNNIKPLVTLATKSIARVFFGHVNIESVYLFTGKTIQGPGWFKVPEKSLGPPLEESYEILFWILGIAFTFVWCGWFYFQLYKTLKEVIHFDFVSGLKELTWQKYFWIWGGSTILILAALPIVYGDARFRVPIWSILIVMYGVALRFKRLHSEHSID